MEKVLGYKKDTWFLFSWCSIVNTDVSNKNKRKLNQKSHFKSHRSTRYCVGLWPYWTRKKTLYESKWNPNHYVWEALKRGASARLNVRLTIIMLRTTIARYGQRLRRCLVPTAFGSWVLVFKEGSFWFWNLNLSNDPRDPCQNLEANSSIFRTDPHCQWHSNEKQKKFQKILNLMKKNFKNSSEINLYTCTDSIIDLC